MQRNAQQGNNSEYVLLSCYKGQIGTVQLKLSFRALALRHSLLQRQNLETLAS